MRDSLYGLLSAFLLGLGQMCMFTGYDTQSFIVEPVLHSVHDRKPGIIDAHAGYYGQAVCLVMFTLANLAAPWVLGLLGSKMTLVVGSSTFTLYLLSFMYVHYIPFYFTAALMGVGFALYYTGNGGYLTEHSSRETIERNSAVSWAIGTICMIVGGVVMLFTIQPPIDVINVDGNLTVANMMPKNATTKEYRQYEDGEIRLMYGAFAIISFISNLIFAFIPKKEVKNSLAGHKRNERVGFVEQLKNMKEAMADRRMIQMAPMFCFVATSICFWMYVYPTTLTFTMKLSNYVYLPAYYSIVLGFGDMLMGFIISFLSKRIPNFAQMPAIIIGATLHMVAMVLALLSTPPWSANTPNNDPTLLIEPSFTLSLLIGFLFGLADNCINTSRTVLCALCMPDKTNQVFSISRFYQSFSASIFVFVAPLMSVPMFFVLIAVNCVTAVIFYGKVASQTRKVEKGIAECAKAATEPVVHPVPLRSVLGEPEKDGQIIDN